ncbi:hypothetical protein TrLO_g1625 [Triparma laevis f. longispina]|uniref:Uncharacterized protein n=1 Tax=Triparma laevis f. longispina TaxID=1714387 RepID=A0A9W7E8X6_9STRA|nr:hypothetical protein TrLO_g1625 [Triparma laevis f. longispina]
MYIRVLLVIQTLLLLAFLPHTIAFHTQPSLTFPNSNPTSLTSSARSLTFSRSSPLQQLFSKRINDKRRKELGIADDEEEYDLGVALERNTDPFITKVIAGSLIVTILGLLIVGVVMPLLSDTGGMCNPALNAGRC